MTIPKRIATISIFVFLLISGSAFAHSDKIAKPTRYVLIFENQSTLEIDSTNRKLIDTYCEDIVNGKVRISRAEIFFANGEVITFKRDESNWTEISVTDGKKTFSVPKQTLDKIPAIHLASVTLGWNGHDQKAFKSSFFYICSYIGSSKVFNQYPELHLKFTWKKFWKAEIFERNEKGISKKRDF